MLDRIIKEGEDVLGIPGEVIFREGVKKFLLSKVEENNSLIKSLKEKYGASGYLELEEKARRGDVPEHPAWEDVILWEELSRHTEALLGLVRRLEAGETDWGSFN